jgi:hypothetical protein
MTNPSWLNKVEFDEYAADYDAALAHASLSPEKIRIISPRVALRGWQIVCDSCKSSPNL